MLNEYEILLQFVSTNIMIRKIDKIKCLVSNFIDDIIADIGHCENIKLPKLIILYNIINSKDGILIQQYIKSVSNIKKFYKKLSRLMSNENMWIVLYSLFILTKLVINDSLQCQLFNKNNINIVFQLVFNLILHGATTDISMLEISVDLLSSMLSNDTMFEFVSNYPKIEKTIEKLLPLLIVFQNDHHQISHCKLIIKLLNILMQSNKLQLIVLKLLNYNRYISVILKLCLYDMNRDYYSDFDISIQAIKLITSMIKCQYSNLNNYDDDDDNDNDNDNDDNINLSLFLISTSHHYPRHADNNLQSLNLSSIVCNQDFISELRKMNFIQDACNVLFGHNQINGNNIMKKLCFAGHINDYSLLSLPQKYVMYFIELLNLICKECDKFKKSFAQLINIQDISYFLCPSKNKLNGEPNQIFLSLINFICSLNDEIVGISYLFKTSLCDSTLICALNNCLNSKTNSKDISNAIQFIYNVFNILSTEQQYDGNNTFISNLFQNKENNNGDKKNRRRNTKQKPRHYGRGGLALSKISNNNNNNNNNDNDNDNSTTISNISINDNNVQNMSSKILYQLFCKKMLRFNKTHKVNHSEINQQAKHIENLKSKYSKSIKSMKKELQDKNNKIEQLKSDLEQITNDLSNTDKDFRKLQDEFDQLNSNYMQIQDDNQTKIHIIQDKTQKIQQLKISYNELVDKADQERTSYLNQNKKLKLECDQFKDETNEIMNKLKYVCDGYKKIQEKFKQNEIDKNELKKRLDHMIARNSDLNHKYNQSDKENVKLNKKLIETQKLASMIQNLMSNNAK